MSLSVDPERILDCDQLREILPHRYPQLMVDRVLLKDNHRAIGLKNVTADEPYFQGHFPGYPVLPGILMLETMIQTGGVVLHSRRAPPLNSVSRRGVVASHQATGLKSGMAWLLSIGKAKFRRPVIPGDQLMIDAEMVRFRNGIAWFRTSASVRNEPTGQAEFTLGIREPVPWPAPMAEPRARRARPPRGGPAAFAPLPAVEGVSKGAAPIMDINGIMKIIPHRSPFLLVDAILGQSESGIIGLKNVTGNEPFFNGHFPDYPVMPGTLLVEAMAQAGAVFMLNLPQYKGKLGYFMSVDSARFRHPVRPGDQLIIDMKLAANRPRMGRGYGRIHVGPRVVAQAQFSFVIMDRPQEKSAVSNKEMNGAQRAMKKAE